MKSYNRNCFQRLFQIASCCEVSLRLGLKLSRKTSQATTCDACDGAWDAPYRLSQYCAAVPGLGSISYRNSFLAGWGPGEG